MRNTKFIHPSTEGIEYVLVLTEGTEYGGYSIADTEYALDQTKLTVIHNIKFRFTVLL